jgi:hypothetical protein
MHKPVSISFAAYLAFTGSYSISATTRLLGGISTGIGGPNSVGVAMPGSGTLGAIAGADSASAGLVVVADAADPGSERIETRAGGVRSARIAGVANTDDSVSGALEAVVGAAGPSEGHVTLATASDPGSEIMAAAASGPDKGPWQTGARAGDVGSASAGLAAVVSAESGSGTLETVIGAAGSSERLVTTATASDPGSEIMAAAASASVLGKLG